MGATPVCQITPAGIVRPDFAACLTYEQTSLRGIYGQDLYLGPDSQDGQFAALHANAYHDCNAQVVAAYNAYSPVTAIGEGLSSVVKINGIRRKVATYSTCDFLSVGQVGTAIPAGVVRDPNGVLWSLAPHVIPVTGQILVGGTCQTIGAITLAEGAVDTAIQQGAIASPTRGWQAVRNPSAASPGQPVETDAALRKRQALSTALPSQTIVEGLWGALLAVAGVTRVRIVENDSGVVQGGTGLPGNTLAVVVEGGDPAEIAALIRRKKSPGVGTYGDVLVPGTDAYGIPKPVRFFRPILTPIAWYVTVRVKAGYTLDVRDTIRTRLAAYTNGLDIGQAQPLREAYPSALLRGDPRAATFEIVDLQAKRADLSSDAYGDITVGFAERLTCVASDVAVTVVP